MRERKQAIFAAVLLGMLAAALLAVKMLQGPGSPRGFSAPRLVRFPADPAWGSLRVFSPDRPHEFDLQFRDFGLDFPESLGSASGDIEVLAGEALHLTLAADPAPRTAGDMTPDLELLSRLGPDDIQGLAFGARLLSPRELKPVSRLRGLGLLSITGNGVLGGTPALTIGAEHLDRLRPLTELRELRLIHVTLAGADLKRLTSLKSIERLTLSRVGGLQGPDLAHLASMPSLRSLSLRDTAITDDAIEALEGLPALEALDLSGTHLSPVGLARFDPPESLRELIPPQSLNDAALAGLIEHTPQLARLTLLDTEVTDEGVAQLARLPALRTIEIESHGYRFDRSNPDAFEITITGGAIRHLREMPGLEEVHLQLGNVTDDHLAPLTDWAALRSLSIPSMDWPESLSDRGLAYLRRLPSLDHLRLGGASDELSASGFSVLAEIQSLRTLTLDHFYSTPGRFSYDFVQRLANLESLNLIALGLTDHDLLSFRALPGLRRVSLKNNPSLTDAAAARLAGMAQLERLDLSRTSITDAGLALLKTCSALSYLDLRDTRVTLRGIQALRRELPNCEIVHDLGPPPAPTPSRRRPIG